MDVKRSLEEILAQANKGAEKKSKRVQSESRLQSACVRWFRMQYPHLRHALFAVPNGAYFANRGAIEGARMKAEGLLPGVADLILLHYSGRCGALLIEMKTKTGRQAKTQKEWQQLMERDGYKYVVCRSLEEFIDAVKSYLL
jgi:hypothetical protein